MTAARMKKAAAGGLLALALPGGAVAGGVWVTHVEKQMQDHETRLRVIETATINTANDLKWIREYLQQKK
jgi:hypothetical protein